MGRIADATCGVAIYCLDLTELIQDTSGIRLQYSGYFVISDFLVCGNGFEASETSYYSIVDF
jgi:hypothetical protein